MARRIGLFVDTGNLYRNIKVKFGQNAKLDYNKYLQWVKENGDIIICNAYGFTDATPVGSMLHLKAWKFLAALKSLGFTTKFKLFFEEEQQFKQYFSSDVRIVVDVLSSVSKLDTVIIGSSSPLLDSLLWYLKKQDIRTIVWSANIPVPLRKTALTLEISDLYLSEAHNNEVAKTEEAAVPPVLDSNATERDAGTSS